MASMPSARRTATASKSEMFIKLKLFTMPFYPPKYDESDGADNKICDGEFLIDIHGIA